MSWLAQVWIDFWKATALFPVEAAVLVCFAVIGSVPAIRRSPMLVLIAGRCRRFGAQRRLVIPLLVILTLAGHFGLDQYRYPLPAFHDEYSYLLAGDTFASGRVTNPPHPLRYFFESFHILVEPTYMSMYPPGQGAALALGQILGGHPAIGVWVSCGALAAAIYWMLLAWAPPAWALWGGLLVVVRIGWFSYWGNSYWGGAMPALGGALLLGAAGRLRRGQLHASSGWLLAAGAVLLMYTRIWEGTLVCATVFGWLLWVGLRKQAKPWFHSRAIAVPFLGVALAGASFLGYYNWRVTGDPLRLPYIENRSRYEVHPSFVWQSARTDRTYNHSLMAQYYFESEGYRDQIPYWQRQIEKPKRIWFSLIGPALTLPLLMSLTLLRRSALRLPMLCLVSFTLGHLVVAWNLLPHYAGPILGAIYIFLINGFRWLSVWRRKSVLSGLTLSRAAIAAVLLMIPIRVMAPSWEVPVYGEYTLPWYSFGLHANTHRAGIEKRLEEIGGKHLILVDYDAGHRADFEWVYNRADIDNATVVWARMAPRPDLLAALFAHFRDRKVWIVYPDQNPGRLLSFQERIR